MTQQVKQSEGAIGYVELIYAISNNLPYADVKNAAGEFVEPSLESVTPRPRSGRPRRRTPTSGCRSPTPPGAEAYPISSFTWLLVRPSRRDSAKGEAIRDFLKWMLEPEAQRMAADLHYAPLPVPVVELVEANADRRA